MSPPEAASGQTQLLERGWNGLSHLGASLTQAALRLADRPLPVLAALVAVQWLAVLAFALTVRHNGLVFYQGGDQINYTTNAWLLGDGLLPPAILGYGWPMLLLPFAWLAEADYVSYLPFTMALNVLVLGPIALACVYALAARIGGRLLGLWAAALWVAAPFLAIPFFRSDYHDRYVEQFLPQALGLTALADFPSMVCLLVAAWLAVRALDAGDWTNAALAGLAAGFGIAIKPANVLFLLGPALLVLFARRFRLVLPYAAGLGPPLLVLLVWKVRGLGDLPLFALEEVRTAAGATLAAPVGVSVDVSRYVDLDWTNFRSNMAELREFFWSARVLQWLPFAGAFAVARRSRAAGEPPHRLVRGLPPRQGNAAAIDRRERQLLPPSDAGVPGLLPARGGVAVARPRRRAPDSGAAAARPAGGDLPARARRSGGRLRRAAVARDLPRSAALPRAAGGDHDRVDPDAGRLFDRGRRPGGRSPPDAHLDASGLRRHEGLLPRLPHRRGRARLRLPGRGIARLSARDAAARVDARASLQRRLAAGERALPGRRRDELAERRRGRRRDRAEPAARRQPVTGQS